jgi:hypothetical protein
LSALISVIEMMVGEGYHNFCEQGQWNWPCPHGKKTVRAMITSASFSFDLRWHWPYILQATLVCLFFHEWRHFKQSGGGTDRQVMVLPELINV